MGAFDSFYFIDETINRLRMGVSGDKSCHAYLFCGVEGTGKRTLAAICARAVNCRSDSNKPCDICPNCHQYLAGSYTDHITLEYTGKAIGVGAVRELIERVGYKPFEGGYYTVVIQRGDMMTQQAQNALLKTLEDPPSKTVFFILAQNEQALLPTIRSRCRLVRLPVLTEDECRQVLVKKGVGDLRARELSEAAQGSVGKAMALDADEEYWPLRERVIKAVAGVKDEKDISLASAAVRDDKGQALAVLDIIEQAAGRIVRTGSNPYGFKLDPVKLLMGVIEARRMLSSNVFWLTVFERLLFDCTE